MIGAYNCYDYYYTNHSGKIVCFKYKSKQKKKVKTIDFIRKHQQESDILRYCKDNNLELVSINKSKKYSMYEII